MIKLPAPVQRYFPYDSVRPHQDEFISTVYEAVSERHSVLIEGSNGLGKTISSLSACIPVAMEKNLRILYVARTHRQHDRVIEELKAIHRKQPVVGVSIRGRNEMCLNAFATGGAFDSKSMMEVCELLKAKGRCPYYLNVNKRTPEYIQIASALSLRPYLASDILSICSKKELCPYELVKSAVADARVIALSYLYVFEPDIRNAFLKNLESDLSKIILIVDEAHNLPETAIDISSSSLTSFAVRQAELEANKFGNKEVERFAQSFKGTIDRLTEGVSREKIVSPTETIEEIEKYGIGNPKEFFELMSDAGTAIKKRLLAEGKNPRSYVHSMGDFLLRWVETADDDAFINVASCYLTRDLNKTAKLEIVALDPAKVTEQVFSSTYANVIMSGTLQPLAAFEQITKLPLNTVDCIVPSPFPKEHVFSAVCLGLTTSMEKRTPAMYQTIIERINEVAENTPTNTGVFAASFEVLNALLSAGLEAALSKSLFHEKRDMTSEQNEKMVSNFKSCGGKGGAVFLGVQGGRTSEGVDFPGNQMNSVCVVGVPYAEPTPRVKAQIDYYEKRFPRLGREYGYILPAMKKASQAAGRPIRTLEDRGAIVFMDYRFSQSYCRGFLPSWITNDMKNIPNEKGLLGKEVDSFFKEV